MRYNFEWDPSKAIANRRKHGVPFELAATVFTDPRALSQYDDEHSEFDDRWITLRLSGTGQLLVVHHAFREVDEDTCMIRIFSTRKATPTEQQQYLESS